MRKKAVSKAARPRKTGRSGQPSRREKILNAAEELFSRRGYYGVSIRDITQLAGVQLALVNYHFGSKEKLYREVIRRRGVEHAAGMQKALDDALAGAQRRRLEPETIIYAFCACIFERLVNGGPGWQRYIQLLARVAESSQEEQFVRPMNELFDPVMDNYARALRKACPHLRRRDFYAAFYFLEAALIYVTANTGGIDRLSGGALRSRNFEQLLPRLVTFFSAGFRSLAGPDTPKRQLKARRPRSGKVPSPKPSRASAIRERPANPRRTARQSANIP